MFSKGTLSLIFLTTLTRGAFAQADAEDHAYLDPPYPHHHRLLMGDTEAIRPETYSPLRFFDLFALPSKSDVLKVIDAQTDVRAQGSRGTCAIFSATALLESLLVSFSGADRASLDLSEEWLEYVKSVSFAVDGSSSDINIGSFKKFGMPTEKNLTYIGETWDSPASSPLAEKRCGKLSGEKLKICLWGHRHPDLLTADDDELSREGGELFDPEFLHARKEASEMRIKHLENVPYYSNIQEESEVKNLLAKGTPVLVDLDFFYGAWNHRKTDELGLERDYDQWHNGIVGYPETDSLDAKVSQKLPAGHSILLVGYDDDEIIRVRSQKADGTFYTHEYKGVYYFKNSWGTQGFGNETKIEGKKFPGYGRITQQYARDFASFFAWKWSNESSL